MLIYKYALEKDFGKSGSSCILNCISEQNAATLVRGQPTKSMKGLMGSMNLHSSRTVNAVGQAEKSADGTFYFHASLTQG